MSNMFGGEFYWNNTYRLAPKGYVCGFCSKDVSSDQGYSISSFNGNGEAVHLKGIYICPSCKGPTFFDIMDNQLPGILVGNSVLNVPEDINGLYTEARKSYSAGAYTGSVLLSRKMLMNLGVNFGAVEGKSFEYYVDYLLDEGYIPKNSKDWVNHIRLHGNTATHKVKLKTAKEAETLLTFIEMLLKINFEYPSHISSQPPK